MAEPVLVLGHSFEEFHCVDVGSQTSGGQNHRHAVVVELFYKVLDENGTLAISLSCSLAILAV